MAVAWHQFPVITGLMVTVLPERHDSALEAIKDFVAQEWPHKTLVVVNASGLAFPEQKNIVEISAMPTDDLWALGWAECRGEWIADWRDDCRYSKRYLRAMARSSSKEKRVSLRAFQGVWPPDPAVKRVPNDGKAFNFLFRFAPQAAPPLWLEKQDLVTRYYQSPCKLKLVTTDPLVIVMPGRLGDLINVLPPCYDVYLRTGQMPKIVACAKYAPLFERVSYVEHIPFAGSVDDTKGALEYAMKLGYAPVNGNSSNQEQDENFLKAQWAKLGYAEQWGELPLVFDQRDTKAEQEMMVAEEPYVVLCLSGQSSPPTKEQAEWLAQVITEECSGWASIVDITKLELPNCVDLLGLLEKALLLVTTDTAVLHLNRANQTPAIHFGRDGFYSSGYVENVVFCCPWTEAQTHEMRVRKELRACWPVGWVSKRESSFLGFWSFFKMVKRPRKDKVTDAIVNYYTQMTWPARTKLPDFLPDSVASLTASGIGDCMMLTDLPEVSKDTGLVHVWAGCANFYELFKFHPSYKVAQNCGAHSAFLIDILKLRDCFDLGNGHILQQLRRAWSLPVSTKPIPVLRCLVPKVKKRVVLHFEPAVISSTRQRATIHPRMRQLYPETKTEIEAFIQSRKDWEFIEIGHHPSGIAGARYQSLAGIAELVPLIASAEWFLGIMSGPIHIAVATGARCVAVVNYPEAERLVMPCLKRTSAHEEEEWYYPQNVHLHQEAGSFLVPKLSRYTLAAAFGGDVYPFWEDKWLNLIE